MLSNLNPPRITVMYPLRRWVHRSQHFMKKGQLSLPPIDRPFRQDQMLSINLKSPTAKVASVTLVTLVRFATNVAEPAELGLGS